MQHKANIFWFYFEQSPKRWKTFQSVFCKMCTFRVYEIYCCWHLVVLQRTTICPYLFYKIFKPSSNLKFLNGINMGWSWKKSRIFLPEIWHWKFQAWQAKIFESPVAKSGQIIIPEARIHFRCGFIKVQTSSDFAWPT